MESFLPGSFTYVFSFNFVHAVNVSVQIMILRVSHENRWFYVVFYLKIFFLSSIPLPPNLILVLPHALGFGMFCEVLSHSYSA